MGIRPLYNRVKIKPDVKETILASGIMLPSNVKQQRSETGVVVSVGEGCKVLKPGDHILFGKYAGFSRLELEDGTETENQSEGTVYNYMNEEDTVGIFS